MKAGKGISILLILAGVGAIAVALVTEVLGMSRQPGLGSRQIILVFGGLVVLLSGAVFASAHSRDYITGWRKLSIPVQFGVLAVMIAALLTSFIYGFNSAEYKIFPYRVVKYLDNRQKNLFPKKESKINRRWKATSLSFTLAGDSIFVGHGREAKGGDDIIDVAATDMDLDGDLDLFINRHLLFSPELFENLGGRFARVNVPGADRSGLFDNRGVPDLFAEEENMIERIKSNKADGLYVWHDTDRAAFWRFHHRKDGNPVEGLTMSLRFNGPVPSDNIVGLNKTEYDQPSKYDLHIPLNEQLASRTFGIAVEGYIGVQLKLRLTAATGVPLPPLFVGRDLVPMATEGLSLWKSDPHGMAWVQAVGSAEPELYIARGGLAGQLTPPLNPKTDLFYEWQGSENTLYRMTDEGFIPSDYGRGRKVEWVDVNNDGINELYLGNTHTPNALLVRDPETGYFQDLASRFGLGFGCGESFAWMDWDEDGFQDLIFICKDRLTVAHNIDGSRFEFLDGRDVGLNLPKFPPESERPLDNQCILRTLDFDNDGRLDLWLSGCETGKGNQLFRRQDGGFVEVTKELNLDAVAGTHLLLIMDVENDGFVDAVSVGEEILVLRNVQGAHFEPERLDVGWNLVKIQAASAGDFNGDGGIDLVLVGGNRYLARNMAGEGNGYLMVHLGPAINEPIGAVVRAHYASGAIQAQRYGSTRNSRLSQVLQPLHFGIPASSSIKAIGVRWPGSTEEELYPVEPGEATLRLKRN